MRMPRIAAALGAVALSLTIVATGPAKPAAAFTVPSPVTIGTAVRAAPLAGPATITCAASVVCGGLVIAGGIGYALYSTRDSWVPVVKDWFNDDSVTPRADGSWGCPITIGAVSAPADGTVMMEFTYGASCGCGSECGPPEFGVTLGNAQCIGSGTSDRALGEVYSGPAGSVGMQYGNQPNGGVGGTWSGVSLVSGCRNNNTGFPNKSTLQVTASRGASAIVDVVHKLPDFLWKVDSNVTCRRPDGSTFTLNGSETGQPDRVSFDSCYEADPSSIPWSAEVNGPGGRDLFDFQSPDWMTEFPNCFGPSGLLCDIFVALDGIKCAVGQALCSDWPHRTENPRLQCRFGEYDVPFDRCEALKRSYRPGATPTEVTDPTGWPQPEPEPDPDPDPPTEPEPSPSPTANPTSPPTSGPNPQPPVIDDPETVDPDSHGCLGANWSWNPVSWVYAPIKCAFLWAFVPSPGFLDGKLESLRDAFNGTMPGSFVAAFTGQTYNLSDSGCGGIPVDWSIEGKSFSFDLLAACSGAMATTASVVKLAASAALVIFGALGCLRGLGAGFGWSPSLGRGGGDSV